MGESPTKPKGPRLSFRKGDKIKVVGGKYVKSTGRVLFDIPIYSDEKVGLEVISMVWIDQKHVEKDGGKCVRQ